MLLSLIYGGGAQLQASCLKELQKAAPVNVERASRPSYFKNTFRNAFGVFVDPYWFPIKVAKAAIQGKEQIVWATRIELVKEGSRAVVGYLLYGLVPDLFVLSIVELHEETNDEFMGVAKNDLIVVVDGFDSDELLDSKRKILVRLLAEEKKRAGYNIEYIAPKDTREFADLLNKIRREKGPIARLDIYSHGFEGVVSIEDTWIGLSTDYDFYPHLDTNIMGKGAMIRFNACLVGRDENFLRRFGKALMPEGGKVVASNLITVPSGTAEFVEYFSERDMPEALDQLQDVALGKLLNVGWIAYLKASSRRGDSFSPTWNPIAEVVVD